MTVKEMTEKLGLTVFAGAGDQDAVVTGGYVSDLLSDVMGHAQQGQVWITLQTHRNAVAIASLKELAAVVLVKGFEPAADTLALARDEGVVLLGTPMETFDVAGRLYELLK